MNRTYEKTLHKIKQLWEDALNLMAIENQILERLDKIEKSVNRLQSTFTKIQKYDKFD